MLTPNVRRGRVGPVLVVPTAFLASTLLLLAPITLVEAGFRVEDLTAFVQILPSTCTDPPPPSDADGGTVGVTGGQSIFDELFDCFTSNIMGQGAPCSGCFSDAFDAPSLPTNEEGQGVLPATCEEAGGMMDVVCSMMECCDVCSDPLERAWECSADGIDTIELADCPLVCDASPMTDTNETAGDPGDLFPVEILPSECVPAHSTWSDCMTSSAPEELDSCWTCLDETSREMTDEERTTTDAFYEWILFSDEVGAAPFPGEGVVCDGAGGVTCLVKRCCPSCSFEMDDVLACVGSFGLAMIGKEGDGSGGDGSGDDGDGSGGGAFPCDITCPMIEITTTTTTAEVAYVADESTTTAAAAMTTTTTTAVTSPMGWAAACAQAFSDYNRCLTTNESTCRRCTIGSSIEELPPSSCAERETFLCDIRGCCEECSVQAESVVDNCRIIAEQGPAGTEGEECQIDCEALEAQTSTTQQPPVEAQSGAGRCGTVAGTKAAAASAAAAAIIGGFGLSAL